MMPCPGSGGRGGRDGDGSGEEVRLDWAGRAVRWGCYEDSDDAVHA